MIFEEAAALLRRDSECVDFGAGIRPQLMMPVDRSRHFCIEPHYEYVQWLREHDYPVTMLTALEAMEHDYQPKTAFALDVIEHMTREDGARWRDLARAKFAQLVIYTPYGFKPQSPAADGTDAWGMSGGHWQEHLSGWEPSDFPGARIVSDGASFFAIYQR